MKDLYNKNFKYLKKEIKENIRRWKDLPCSWISRINIVKMAILLKAIYGWNAIHIKIPTILYRPWKDNTLFHEKKKNPNQTKQKTNKKTKQNKTKQKNKNQITKPKNDSYKNLNNQRTSGGITISNFKLFYRAIVEKPTSTLR